MGLWIEQLAAGLNLPVPQPYPKGGLNYATASAQTGSNPAYSPLKPTVPWSTDQVKAFLKSNPVAPANHLYTFWCGADDLLNGASATTAASKIQENIDTLANAGAKYFLWVNMPPMGDVPQEIGTSQSAALNTAAESYNTAMTAAVAQLTAAHPGITIATFDVYSEFLTLIQNPSLYGFANITDPAQGLAGINPNTYLFWDTLHPTTVGHAEIAEGAYSVIVSVFEGHPLITSVVNAEDANMTIAPNTWVAVKGTALSTAGDTRIWLASDFTNGQLPQALDGVSVTLNNENAYVYYISATQINVLTPPDLAPGPVIVQVSLKGETSGLFAVESQAAAPAFFCFRRNSCHGHARERRLPRADDPIPRLDNAGSARRNGGALRQWFRSDVGSGGCRRPHAIRCFAAAAGGDHWRHPGQRAVRGACQPRVVSVQRGGAARRRQRRHTVDGGIRRNEHAKRSSDRRAGLTSRADTCRAGGTPTAVRHNFRGRATESRSFLAQKNCRDSLRRRKRVGDVRCSGGAAARGFPAIGVDHHVLSSV